MRQPTTKTLFFLGLLLGVGVVMAATTFAPGDAGKVSDGVTFESPSGTEAKLYGTTNVTMDDVFPNSTTHGSQFADRSVILNTSQGGNITLASDNSVHAGVHTSNMTGTWTNLTEITTNGNTLEVYPQTKQRADLSGDLDQFSLRNVTVDDDTTDFWVEGASGTATVQLHDLPTNTRIVAVQPDGTYLDHDTTDANGNGTFNIGLSSQTVQLQTKSSTEEAKHTNPSPTGQVTSDTVTLSIDINDSDFPQDDVEVNISYEGTVKKSTNITSNQTVTVDVTINDLGTKKWYVNTTDAYGNTNSTNYTFSTPKNITLRNETDASQIIKDKNVTVTFYSTNGKTVVQRSDSNEDGKISLQGLPNTAFVVTYQGPGWYDRRAYVNSIFDQQDIYLLNSTAFPTASDEAIETTFVYEDRTGRFDQDETTLEIQRAVDKDDDGNFNWTTVAGDFWGAAGEFPFTGEYQERYRLIITNRETGESRNLGTHIPVDDGVKNIIVGDIIFEAENATGVYWDAAINQNTTNLQAYYNDPTNSTTDLRIRIYRQGNQSNEIYNQTFSGPLGEKAVSVSLNDTQAEQNWVVEFDGTDDDGRVFGEVLVGGVRYALPIDPEILTAFMFSMITFVMAMYGPRTSTMGAWAGALFYTGVMFLGWISFNAPGLVIVFLAVAGGTFYKEAMPS